MCFLRGAECMTDEAEGYYYEEPKKSAIDSWFQNTDVSILETCLVNNTGE